MFVDSRDKEVKHAFASMFVEILLPVAAGANRELNVPALKSFVDTMYHHTFDLTKKTRHSQVSLQPLQGNIPQYILRPSTTEAVI